MEFVDKINGIFEQISAAFSSVLNNVGLLLSGLSTAILVIILIWQGLVTLKELNSGNRDVWSEKGALLLGLIALAIFMGVVTSTFLGSSGQSTTAVLPLLAPFIKTV